MSLWKAISMAKKRMTKTQWLVCADPQKMLNFLRASSKVSERKFRLFACACVRQIWWSELNKGSAIVPSRRANSTQMG